MEAERGRLQREDRRLHMSSYCHRCGIAIPSVYDLLDEHTSNQCITKRQPKRGSARTGIYRARSAASWNGIVSYYEWP